MRITDILRVKGSEVVTIEPHRTVADAIETLNRHKIGGLVVTGADGRIAGIITERDILRVAAEQCDRIKETVIGDVMTKDVIIGVPEDKLDYVMGIMTKNRIRHMPVIDGDQLVGIVSIGDVVNAHLEEREFENRLLRDYIHGATH
ncbi:MAG: CBS domain-containing protein [Gemmatimonadales bacterium]